MSHIIAILASGGGGGTGSSGGGSYTPPVLTGTDVVIKGNSIAAGAAAGGGGSWSVNFCAAKGATEVNLARAGDVLQVGEVCGIRGIMDMGDIPTYVSGTSGFMWLQICENDIGMNNGDFTPAGFEARLNVWVTNCVVAGWPTGRLGILTPSYVAPAGYDLYTQSPYACNTTTAADGTRVLAYRQAVINVCQDNHCVLADIYTEMTGQADPDSLLSGDYLHPNDAGHAVIANYLISLPLIPE